MYAHCSPLKDGRRSSLAMTVNRLHVACPHMFYSCSGGWTCSLLQLSKLLHATVGLAFVCLYVILSYLYSLMSIVGEPQR
jgi:hypothetical protein